jgi:hypothetical protein
MAPVHVQFASATLEGRKCPSAQDGFAAATSAVNSDNIDAVVASGSSDRSASVCSATTGPWE